MKIYYADLSHIKYNHKESKQLYSSLKDIKTIIKLKTVFDKSIEFILHKYKNGYVLYNNLQWRNESFLEKEFKIIKQYKLKKFLNL